MKKKDCFLHQGRNFCYLARRSRTQTPWRTLEGQGGRQPSRAADIAPTNRDIINENHAEITGAQRHEGVPRSSSNRGNCD